MAIQLNHTIVPARDPRASALSIASTMGVALSEAHVRQTIELVRHLSEDMKARSEL